MIDEGERAEDSAQRELEEETGYQVKGILEKSPAGLVSSAGLSDEAFQYVFVEAVPGKGQRLEAAEQIEVLLLSLEDLQSLFERRVLLSSRLWALCHGYLAAGRFPELTTGSTEGQQE